MTLGLLLFGFFPTWTVVVAAAAILGFGMGVFLAADLALGSQVLPTAEDRGKDIGIINTAIFLPMILAPLIVGATVGALHSYLLLFSLLAVGTLCSAALIARIRSVR
jgi:MFS family permease